jgi:hypothetical protein
MPRLTFFHPLSGGRTKNPDCRTSEPYRHPIDSIYFIMFTNMYWNYIPFLDDKVDGDFVCHIDRYTVIVG